MSRAAIFVNEGAGSGTSTRARRTIELVRDRLDAEVHVTATRDPATFGRWLAPRVEGCTTAVIAGGDGSLGVAYNVVAEHPDMTLGYIPAGFGNASAHLLRLPREPEALAEVIAEGEARPIDLVAVDGRLALFAGAGWDAMVARRYAEAGAHRLPGWFMAATRSLPELWRRPIVEIRADGWTVHRGPLQLLVVSTTPFYGRGLRVNPGARPDAGQLTARAYADTAPRLAVEAVRWALRRDPRARPVAASEVVVRSLDGRPIEVQADGDVIGAQAEWRFEIRPAAVRLIGRWK
jgi:diacylglycerol kinase (ATP)